MAGTTKRLLLIGATTGYQTRVFAEAAERLGFELVLATDRCHVLDDPWGDRAIALRFEDPEGAAQTLAAEARVDGIVAVGDRPAYIAALAAERLGIPYNSSDSVHASRNKFLARERFRAARLLVPEFHRVPLAEGPDRAAQHAPYPCVLKPLGLSASRGVIRADNPTNSSLLSAASKTSWPIPTSRGSTKIRTAFCKWRHSSKAANSRWRGFSRAAACASSRFSISPIHSTVPSSRRPSTSRRRAKPESTQRAIVQATEGAIRALGLSHGPIHAEMRVNSRGVWMLEVAARPIGGLCARVLPGLEELILRHASGVDPGSIAATAPASGVMMIPIPREGIYADTEGLEQARAQPGIEDVIITAKLGQKLIPLPEGASYLGFIFARGESPDAVDRSLRSAHQHLRFEIATALPTL